MQPLSNKKAVLSLIGLTIIIVVFKSFWLPSSSEISNLQGKLVIQYSFNTPVEAKTTLRLPIPYSTKANRVVSQSIHYNGWRIIKRNYKGGLERGLVLTATENQPGPIKLEYYFSHSKLTEKPKTRLKPEEQQKYTYITEKQQESVSKFSQMIDADNIKKKLNSQFEITDFLTQYAKFWGAFKSKKSLTNQSCEQWMSEQKTLLISLRNMQIPTRNVCGIAIENNGYSYKRSWLEVYNGHYWQVVDLWPENTVKLLPLTKSLDEYSKLTEDKAITENISYIEVPDESSAKFNLEKLYNLKLLPLDVQETLKIILTLPFAILVIAYLKTLFRIEVYGNLTPALLGLALAFNELFLSLTIMALIFLPTIYVRKLVSNQNKIVEHTVTLTFLILILILVITIADMFAWIDNPSDALLPVVILALLIDKYFVNLTKHGRFASNLKMLNTLVLSLIVVAILQLSFIGDWLLKYPELHLITIALAVLLCKPHNTNKQTTPTNDTEIKPK